MWSERAKEYAMILVIALVLTLGGLAGAFLATLPANAALGDTPRCEAEVIAEWAPLLTQDEWVAVIDEAEEKGQVTAEHAAELRALIAEVYVRRQAKGFIEWLKAKCNGVTI